MPFEGFDTESDDIGGSYVESFCGCGDGDVGVSGIGKRDSHHKNSNLLLVKSRVVQHPHHRRVSRSVLFVLDHCERRCEAIHSGFHWLDPN